ncbi:MAG: hypothetical protein K1000chlam2_00323 [Chlamydiae bacterium]|nr:hypothetical protein [Chlamydiota bacterium]
MWKPIIRCGIVGGVLVFLWYMLSWMVLPMHKGVMNKFAEPSEVTSCITRYAPHDGIYVIPGWEAEPEPGQPFIMVNIKRGVDFSNTSQMICGVITNIIAAGFITYLLLRAKAMKYWNRVWFVTVVGIVVALVGVVPAWNWWHYPAMWSVLEMFDILVGWFLGGLVIAKLVKN